MNGKPEYSRRDVVGCGTKVARRLKKGNHRAAVAREGNIT
jgi:hypothetical protein